ncbi:MAG: bifunctional diaminohydroxyphosphoribosylaminopyrimidine deaminase/5-amino-6-(5-phosphoribosylamino)uracil reductase RibD [Flavobacteriia bacterium]|nr:bifunctional diaminohydroxyphosphoribosylaminopyrimidine deaminase/5-amino-6-(5-phosphoribosylamino)uracil reductase RibD [Flavobacteriia bacterium]
MDFDELMMKRCIELAENGLGMTYPNPVVGCVIVRNGRIISEGWHQKAGEAHAEVNAVNKIKDKEILKECEIYVSLEPCSHFGKTPPCSDMIVRYGFKRVIVGISDPNSKVNGQGIERMRDAGIEVKVGVLENECAELNKRFFCFHQNKRPYIILKWAQTADGFMAAENHVQKWITNQYSKQLVHLWRSQEQSVLVGYNTAKIDNPQLNLRLWSGNQPVRAVIDRDLSLDSKLHLFDGSQQTIIFSDKEDSSRPDVIQLKFDENLEESILEELYKSGLQSVIIEGGRKTLDRFISNGLWDEARIFSSSENWVSGIKAPLINGKLTEQKAIGCDSLKIFRK